MKRTKCSVCLSVCRPISGLLVPNIYSEIRLLLFFQSSPVLIAPLRAAGRFLETIKTRDSWKRPVGQDSRTQFWETPFLARSHDRTRQDSGKRHSPPPEEEEEEEEEVPHPHPSDHSHPLPFYLSLSLLLPSLPPDDVIPAMAAMTPKRRRQCNTMAMLILQVSCGCYFAFDALDAPDAHMGLFLLPNDSPPSPFPPHSHFAPRNPPYLPIVK